MTNFENMHCKRVKKSELSLCSEKIKNFLTFIPYWVADTRGDIKVIRRRFVLEDYSKAIKFINDLTELSDAEDHHPEVIFGFIYVEVIYWTHVVNGLHLNDFIMASKINAIFEKIIQ